MQQTYHLVNTSLGKKSSHTVAEGDGTQKPKPTVNTSTQDQDSAATNQLVPIPHSSGRSNPTPKGASTDTSQGTKHYKYKCRLCTNRVASADELKAHH